MPEIKTENGKKYVNSESEPVECIEHRYYYSLSAIGKYLLSLGVLQGDQITENGNDPYLCMVDSYRDADEENPSQGDYYVIFPNKKVLLYTPAEFEANFKLI